MQHPLEQLAAYYQRHGEDYALEGRSEGNSKGPSPAHAKKALRYLAIAAHLRADTERQMRLLAEHEEKIAGKGGASD